MTITLTRLSVPTEEFSSGSQHVWPISVEATSDTPELSSAIFVYHATDYSKAATADICECVASLPQMTSLPENAPQPDPATGQVVPYYRKNVLIMHCWSADEADELWEKIKGDVRDLLVNFKASKQLRPSDIVAITV